MITQNIYDYIKQKGIKQTFICEKTGLTKQCLNSVLNGRRKLDVEEYSRICQSLDVPYSFFFDYNRKSAS